MKYLLVENNIFLIKINKEEVKLLRDTIIKKFTKYVSYSEENYDLDYIKAKHEMMVMGLHDYYQKPRTVQSNTQYEIYPDIIDVIDSLLRDDINTINKFINLDIKDVVENKKMSPYYIKLKNTISLTKVNDINSNELSNIYPYDENIRFNEYVKNPIKRILKYIK